MHFIAQNIFNQSGVSGDLGERELPDTTYHLKGVIIIGLYLIIFLLAGLSSLGRGASNRKVARSNP